MNVKSFYLIILNRQLSQKQRQTTGTLVNGEALNRTFTAMYDLSSGNFTMRKKMLRFTVPVLFIQSDLQAVTIHIPQPNKKSEKLQFGHLK